MGLFGLVLEVHFRFFNWKRGVGKINVGGGIINYLSNNKTKNKYLVLNNEKLNALCYTHMCLNWCPFQFHRCLIRIQLFRIYTIWLVTTDNLQR